MNITRRPPARTFGLPNLFLCLLVLLLLGCDATNNASLGVDDLSNTRWLLQRAETREGAIMAADAPQPAAIEFGLRDEDTRTGMVSGYNGCNVFSGKYEVTENGELRFFDIVQSLRACTESEARIESVFMEALEDAGPFSIVDDELVIEAPSRGVSLVFARTLDAGNG